ncbi:hypothetical protein HMPREF9506_01981 [Enterococcus faecalis TX0309A]|uniref:Uncharacterized protein n=1 Tax=Enterococcus faecalis ERV63 TaxID=1134793 RepID=A0AAV3GG19_ENTFL|nr:hypothetical protein HMPREF0348_0091 [Enterococcus faecalis TX0104]EEI56556.1 hypothetical protein HMPREF0346_2425 [Enterococcus faecalis EnGen0297]EFM72188.1 hypothetical protein HMPREF9515_02725 [Enterococcus faecalis TX0860]EFU86845.1 hypothetical protein HMPREF9507_01746 [Enterococcus faecalis TX0309B]EFU93230.1 hypothetical protein HMPREF9506_01981 [Enterococcus faecalis TX0309A]EJU84413.1 hypothetical protein HMPREF1329_03046 [Enterococcus faecalis ERV116]EJU84716.1 hypothetical prot
MVINRELSKLLYIEIIQNYFKEILTFHSIKYSVKTQLDSEDENEVFRYELKNTYFN